MDCSFNIWRKLCILLVDAILSLCLSTMKTWIFSQDLNIFTPLLRPSCSPPWRSRRWPRRPRRRWPLRCPRCTAGWASRSGSRHTPRARASPIVRSYIYTVSNTLLTVPASHCPRGARSCIPSWWASTGRNCGTTRRCGPGYRQERWCVTGGILMLGPCLCAAGWPLLSPAFLARSWRPFPLMEKNINIWISPSLCRSVLIEIIKYIDWIMSHLISRLWTWHWSFYWQSPTLYTSEQGLLDTTPSPNPMTSQFLLRSTP